MGFYDQVWRGVEARMANIKKTRASILQLV